MGDIFQLAVLELVRKAGRAQKLRWSVLNSTWRFCKRGICMAWWENYHLFCSGHLGRSETFQHGETMDPKRQVCRSTSVNKGRFLRIVAWLSFPLADSHPRSAPTAALLAERHIILAGKLSFTCTSMFQAYWNSKMVKIGDLKQPKMSFKNDQVGKDLFGLQVQVFDLAASSSTAVPAA